VRRLTKQPQLTAIIYSCRLTLFGHIACMDDNADAKRILLAFPLADWRRRPENPCIAWLSTVQQDLRHHHLMLPEAADMAQNCRLWRMLSTYGAILQLHARNDDDDDLTKMINDTALHSVFLILQEHAGHSPG